MKLANPVIPLCEKNFDFVDLPILMARFIRVIFLI